nr:hypothetical protein [Tanacetum cinerariifolium]
MRFLALVGFFGGAFEHNSLLEQAGLWKSIQSQQSCLSLLLIAFWFLSLQNVCWVEEVDLNVSRSGTLTRQGAACDRDLRMLIPFRGCLLVRGSELEASVDKLFDKGASGDGQDVKRRLWSSGGASAIGKSMFAVQSLFTEAVLNAEARAEVDSIDRSFAPAIATVTTMTATIDTDATAARAPATPSLFGVGSSLTSWTDSVPGGFSDVSSSDFLIGGICTVVDPDFDLQKVYLFIEFNVGAARQISLNDEVRMRAEYNIREKRKLRAVVDEQAELLKVKYGEIESIKAQLMLKEAEAAEAIRLQAQVFKFKAAEQSLRGAAISKAVEKGLKEGLSAGITHGPKGRKLADVTAYNPSTEADYLSALQHLQNVNISLIAELKSNKDATDGSYPPFSGSACRWCFRFIPFLGGFSFLGKKMRENIAKHVSALRGMFVPLSEPLSVGALEGMEGTSDSTHDATTTLSMTFVFASTVPPIFTYDYEVAHVDCQGVPM